MCLSVPRASSNLRRTDGRHESNLRVICITPDNSRTHSLLFSHTIAVTTIGRGPRLGCMRREPFQLLVTTRWLTPRNAYTAHTMSQLDLAHDTYSKRP